MKKFAQTIEFEQERKKVEKLKNHEFNNQGRWPSLPPSLERATPYAVFIFRGNAYLFLHNKLMRAYRT